jgi:two-component system response regulator RegA
MPERTTLPPVAPDALPSILVVDDDATFRDRLAKALTGRGFQVRTAADGNLALEQARAESPEFAVVDLRMPGKGGLEVVRELKAIDPSTKVLVLTGFGSIATALEAVRLGATHYLQKPADVESILAAFSRDAAEPLLIPFHYEVPTLARAEWEHINRVLTDCGGNVSEAARRLGIHRRSLQRKLNKHPPGR